ncbi:MAG: ankyrin repeat domain-containing protein [Gammaproteobacteria bacterium]
MIKILTASYGGAPFRIVFTLLVLYAVIPGAVAVAADPVTARKDLKEMGVEYTEQQFAKSAGEGDRVAVGLFLDAGMNVNAGGGAALGLAAGRGQLEMVKLLLSEGAEATSNALQFARTRGHTQIEKILLEAGAKE